MTFTMFRFLLPMDELLNTSIHVMFTTVVHVCDEDFDQDLEYASCREAPDNESSIGDSNYRQASFYCALLMLCFCVIGIVGNVISVLIFTRPSMRSSPITALLTVLSIVDCWVLSAAVAVFVIPGLNTFLTYIDPRKLYALIITGFYQLGMTAQTASVWTFVLISLERYLAVVHPLRVQQLLSAKRAMMAEVTVIVFAFLYNIPRFFEYQPDEAYGYATLLRASPQYFTIYYTTLYLVTHFLIPFLTIAVLNGLIFKAVRKARKERKQLTRSDKSPPANTNRTTTMVVMVTLIFGSCNVLPFILNIWEALEPNLFESSQRTAAYLILDVSNVLVVFNSSSTFIIYYAYCQRYRFLLKEGLHKCLPDHLTPETDPPSATDPSRSSHQQHKSKKTVRAYGSFKKSNIELSDYETVSAPLLHSRRP